MTDEITLNAVDITCSKPLPGPQPETFHQAKTRVVAQFEQRYLKELLLTHGGNITKAAQAAGKNRRAFWQLLRKHGIKAQCLTQSGGSDLDKS